MNASRTRASATASASSPSPHTGAKRIAVIGAGIAGLACARTLMQAGHDVTLLESGPAPGGRMATCDSPVNGRWPARAWAGAGSIPPIPLPPRCLRHRSWREKAGRLWR